VTVVLAVVALVLAVLLVAAAIVGARTRTAQRDAGARAADATERLTASRRQLTEVQRELATARDALARAEAATIPAEPTTQSPPEAVVEPAGEAISRSADVLGSLWTLERLELDVHRRRQAAETPDAVSTYATVLGGAIEREVERIREEVGTPGELHSELGNDPDEETGLVVLGAIRRTLAAVARGCEAYDLYVKTEHGRLQVKVVCELFDGAWMEDTAADVGAVASAVAPAGATAVFRPGEAGAAVAELSFPVE
jgi:hypothetical protein